MNWINLAAEQGTATNPTTDDKPRLGVSRLTAFPWSRLPRPSCVSRPCSNDFREQPLRANLITASAQVTRPPHGLPKALRAKDLYPDRLKIHNLPNDDRPSQSPS